MIALLKTSLDFSKSLLWNGILKSLKIILRLNFSVVCSVGCKRSLKDCQLVRYEQKLFVFYSYLYQWMRLKTFSKLHQKPCIGQVCRNFLKKEGLCWIAVKPLQIKEIQNHIFLYVDLNQSRLTQKCYKMNIRRRKARITLINKRK